MPYYVVRGAYTLEQLRGRSPSNHLTTLFDTESPTCSDPSEGASVKPSDGDLKVRLGLLWGRVLLVQLHEHA